MRGTHANTHTHTHTHTDGLTREQMVAAYKKAVVVIDLWLPGAETVTAEGAMFDCCVLVPRDEMNGANQRDFPISPHLKIGRTQDGNWNYTGTLVTRRIC